MEKIKKDCFLRFLLSLSYPKYFVKFLKKVFYNLLFISLLLFINPLLFKNLLLFKFHKRSVVHKPTVVLIS